jgi:hypothetical protein
VGGQWHGQALGGANPSTNTHHGHVERRDAEIEQADQLVGGGEHIEHCGQAGVEDPVQCYHLASHGENRIKVVSIANSDPLPSGRNV